MSAGETVIAAAAAMGGVGAAVFAWVQAKAAVGSRQDAQEAQNEAEAAQWRAEHARDEALRLAREANQVAQRQAEALERSNELLEAARDTESSKTPPTWSKADPVTGNSVQFVNESGNTLVVTDVQSIPKGVQVLSSLSLPVHVEPGDKFKIWWQSVLMQDAPKRVLIKWHHVDEHFDPQTTKRSI